MTIEQLPSGSYRIKQMRDGKMYRATVDHKPTKHEAEKILQEMIGSRGQGPRMSFADACEDYFKIKSNVLSPSTIRGYMTCKRALSPVFLNQRICDLTSDVIQREVNSYAADHSPKSTRNIYGLISTILRTYAPDLHYVVTLPPKRPVSVHMPTEEDVRRIYEYAKNTPYYIPLVLAGMGMRRSEILAADISDLEGNTLHIRRGMVQDTDDKWIIKETPKTERSVRDIVLPDKLADMIRAQGYIYNGHPEYIWRFLRKAQNELGIENFPLHKMRHFFASYAHNVLRLTDEQIMSAGGWKSDHILKSTYRHAMEEEASKTKIAAAFGDML